VTSDGSGARERILSRIRSRQGKPSETSPEERAAVRSHIGSPSQHPRPRFDWELLARFRERAIGLSSTVEEVGSLAAVPAAVARYLGSNSLPLTATCWPEFGALDWRAAGVGIEVRPARDDDRVGVTGAFCAIAETGTLMTVTGPQTPAATSLLPETHIAVLPAARIVRGMEEAWQLARNELKQLPRAVNFISGPSRTADIEQTVTLGAHGPYRVHVILVT
jgi:L-lactate dehydrogenase complex protein LldG